MSLAWGVLAFGAVYPWAYWPLFAAAATIGVAGLVARRNRPGVERPLVVAGALLIVAVALQLVPLPHPLLAAISPHTDRLLRELDVGYAAGATRMHPLSIDPRSTSLALAALIALVLFASGLSRLLSTHRAIVLAHSIVGLGALVALIGIVQRSTGTCRIYGFWEPFDHPYQIFGPFVNKNHFSGWMIMALSMAIGVFCARIAATDGARSDWRSRLLWWSSADASQLLLVAGAIVVMAFAIVLTRSRSGAVCLTVIVTVAVLSLLRQTSRGRRGARRVISGTALGLLVIAAVSWAGTGPVLRRMRTETPLNGRLDAWRAGIRIASDFPEGTGLNTFASAMLFYQPKQLTARWDVAHNDYVQLMAEGGWWLGVPIVIFAAAVVWQVRLRLRAPQSRRIWWIRFGAVLGLLGIGVQELVDFSLQLPGVAILCAALVALALQDAN